MDYRQVGGRRNTPQVINDDGHAHVHAWVESPISLASWRGDAFTILTEHTIVAANTKESVMWLQNDRAGRTNGRSQVLVIQDIHISSELGSHVELFLDPVYTSGGRDVEPIMAHRGRVTTKDVTLKDSKIGALVMDTLNAIEIRSIFLGARSNHYEDFHGMFMLPDGKSIMAQVNGPIGERVRIAMDCYWTSEPE